MTAYSRATVCPVQDRDEEFRRYVKQLIKKGMPQAAVAQAMGMRADTFSRWLNEKTGRELTVNEGQQLQAWIEGWRVFFCTTGEAQADHPADRFPSQPHPQRRKRTG